jgi:hypothetical protein
MKISNRLGVVATSLLLLAVGVTGVQTSSFAKRETPKKKTSGKATTSKPKTAPVKWNGAVFFKEYRLQCIDEELLKLNGYKDAFDLAGFYVVFSGDSSLLDEKFNGIQLYFLYRYKKKTLRYDVVLSPVAVLKENIGKSPELKVVVQDEVIDSPWKEVTLQSSGNGPKMKASVQGLGKLILSNNLSLVVRDRKTKIIVAAISLGNEGIKGGGAADPGDFIVKPTPTPPPPAP